MDLCDYFFFAPPSHENTEGLVLVVGLLATAGGEPEGAVGGAKGAGTGVAKGEDILLR